MNAWPATLYIVIPCYNEEEVLPLTLGLFLDELSHLVNVGLATRESRILLVDDGSTDATWDFIQQADASHQQVEGVKLSRNRGHQHALLAGLMTARGRCDCCISIDADGQDDMRAMEEMMQAFVAGCDVVYGVRDDRSSDTAFKRTTAQGFYKLLRALGADTVYNHADYRLLSARALDALAEYKEVNIYLRGMVPMIGLTSTCVPYTRTQRLAGKSHYPLSRMLSLALDGITSLSTKPLHLISLAGVLVTLVSFIGIIWAIVMAALGATVPGWASTVVVVCFFGGIQMLCLGVIGEYIGKIYTESKHRPRYLIEKTTFHD